MSKIKGGMITALVTPFDSDKKVDFNSLAELIQQQLQGGVDAFVVNGTTAESPSLELNEIRELFTFIKSQVPEGFPLILGAGTNSTAKTIKLIQSLEDLKADAYLVVTPYYNKPTQKGLYEHFKSIAAATATDIILYDVPSRTVVEQSVALVKELSEISNIIGIKDATGNIEKLKELRKQSPSDFLLLSGDDETAAEFIKEGGDGVISVLSHLCPKAFKRALSGELDFASLLKLSQLIFKEPNPTPVKEGLRLLGVIRSSDLRLPLLKCGSELSAEIKKELEAINA